MGENCGILQYRHVCLHTLLWKCVIILEFESSGTSGIYNRMHKSESYLCLLPKRKKKGILWPIFALICDCPVLSVCHSCMLATGARLMVNGLIGTEPAIIPFYVYLTVLLITLDNKSKKKMYL